MSKEISIDIKIADKEEKGKVFSSGTTLKEMLDSLSIDNKEDYVAALVNKTLKELNWKIYKN